MAGDFWILLVHVSASIIRLNRKYSQRKTVETHQHCWSTWVKISLTRKTDLVNQHESIGPALTNITKVATEFQYRCNCGLQNFQLCHMKLLNRRKMCNNGLRIYCYCVISCYKGERLWVMIDKWGIGEWHIWAMQKYYIYRWLLIMGHFPEWPKYTSCLHYGIHFTIQKK